MSQTNRKNNPASLGEIRQLLSNLHGEIATLESNYAEVLGVLRKYEQKADLDDLTGLPRRQAFIDGFKTLMDECQTKDEGLGLLMIDIDHFKKINDTHGHPTGDEVIRAMAELLKQYASKNVVVGRIGGEEFAVAAKGSPAEVIALAEFIRRAAERLHGPTIDTSGMPSATVQWKCTISIGMTPVSPRVPLNHYPEEADHTVKVALTAADAALYLAKQRGRNQVCAGA